MTTSHSDDNTAGACVEVAGLMVTGVFFRGDFIEVHMGDVIEVGDTDRVFTNPRHRLTEDYITGRFG